jgi:hypothetical protein
LLFWLLPSFRFIFTVGRGRLGLDMLSRRVASLIFLGFLGLDERDVVKLDDFELVAVEIHAQF